jgi:hypothetical protein
MPSNTAFFKALAIVTYFIVSTAWIPNQVVLLGSAAALPRLAGDLIASAVWLGALLFGLRMLRRLQERGSI